MREELKQQLTLEEGLRLKPYHDTTGNLTIGIGRNLDHVGISTAEADMMLENDLIKVEAGLISHLNYFYQLDQVRQDVLIEMAFNMGVLGLLQFRNMLAAVSIGNYDSAADEMLKSVWAEQVGERAAKLSQMMKTGVRT